jgi:hypothetical protein
MFLRVSKCEFRNIEKIDYKKGRGNLRLWFARY